MITRHSLARWVPLSLSFLGVVGAACGDDADGTASPPSVDGSTDTGALPSSSDATTDAPTDGGATGTVTVLVEDRFGAAPGPIPAAPVVFHDTDGTVVRATTGADGRASAVVHDGATVSAFWRYSDGYTEITSVVGVGLGETIEITLEPTGYPPQALLHFEGESPAGSTNGTAFRFYTGQGGSGGDVVPNTYTTEASYPLVDGTGFRFVGFAPASATPSITPTKYAVGLAAKNPDGGTSYGSVAAADWADVASGPLALIGAAPAGATSWTWDLGQANAHGLYPMIHVDQPTASAALPASYGRVPTNVAADVYLEGKILFGSGKQRSARVRRAPNTGTITEDLGAYLPPLTASVSGAPAAPALALSTSTPLPGPASAWCRLVGPRTTADGGPAETDWIVVHRHTGAPQPLPEIPADLQAEILPATWKVEVATLFDSPEIDFATVRKNPRNQARRVTPWRWTYPKTPFEARFTRVDL